MTQRETVETTMSRHRAILRLLCAGVVLVSVGILALVIIHSVKGCTDRQHLSCWFGLRVIIR